MRIKPFLIVIFFAQLHFTSAQEVPAFGKVSTEELTMKECSFDHDAPAMYLVNEETITYREDYYGSKTEYEVRERIKIFNSRGYQHATIIIPDAKSRSSKVTDIDAFVYNLDDDGKVKAQKVSRDQIFKEKGSKRKVNSLRFTFPDLKPGSIVEYRYTKKKQNTMAISPWLFQDQIPTLYSSCKIILPTNVDLQARVVASQVKQEDSATASEETKIHRSRRFTFKHVSGFTVEPYMSSLIDNIGRVEFSISHRFHFFGATDEQDKWQLLGDNLKYSYFFGMQCNTRVDSTDKVIDSIKKFSTNDEKINAVYELVKQSIKWMIAR